MDYVAQDLRKMGKRIMGKRKGHMFVRCNVRITTSWVIIAKDFYILLNVYLLKVHSKNSLKFEVSPGRL